MSTSAGKVELLGIQEIHGEKVFLLRFVQARNAAWCYLPFFAEYDEAATWFGDLRPAFGDEEFFFEPEFRGHFDEAAGERNPENPLRGRTAQDRDGGGRVVSLHTALQRGSK
jgi:hypothetical protein